MLIDLVRSEERLLIREFGNAGVDLRLVNVDRVPLDLDRINEELLADAVLVRVMSHVKAITVARLLNMMGVATINRGDALDLSWNKALTLARLKSLGIPTVPSKLVMGYANGDPEYPLIVKPISGSWGRLIGLVRSGEELGLLLSHRRLMGGQHSLVLIQPFIGDGTDYRLFVIGGEVVAAMMRRPSADDWRSNVARGGRAFAIKPSPEMEELAVKAVEALGLDYAGVDLIYSEDRGYMVNEVNGVPEFRGLMSVTNINIAGRLVDYVVGVVRR